MTSFEPLYIIGPQTTSEKCFNSAIENASCRCQYGVKCGKKEIPLLDCDPTKGFLHIRFQTSVPNFIKNIKIPTVRAQTDRHTNTQMTGVIL